LYLNAWYINILTTRNKTKFIVLTASAERNLRRVDGSSTDFDLHRLVAAADGGGSGD